MAIASAADTQDNVPEYGGQYTPERITNLRANVQKYTWAAEQRDQTIQAAEHWVNLSNEDLWNLVPGQNLPRNIDPQMDHGTRTGGCPVCGVDVYANNNKYPWKVDVWKAPWKVTCPACNTHLPHNDFGAYYRSGIDETGCFNLSTADPALLFNAEHPDPNDPLHKAYVDNGWGFETPDGAVNRFIGYYGYALWNTIKSGVNALARAYLFTGDPRYAQKCAMLLDRIADVYPDMDWSVYGQKGWFHSGSQVGGKIEGSIWETGTVYTLSGAYDMIKSGLQNQPELYSFLANKSQQYRRANPKGTYAHLVANIETNLLTEFVKAVQNGRTIYGNEGGPQHCVTVAALALNRQPRTGEWIDWIFKEGNVGQGAIKPGQGGHIPALVVGAIDRDGAGAEGSPSYSLMWGNDLGVVADLLHNYEGYKHRDIYRDYPVFKQTITVGWRLGVLASRTPNIGDTGRSGSHALIGAEPEFLVRGYRLFGDKQAGLAAVYANRGKTEGLGRDIFSKDPLKIEKELENLVKKHGTEPPISGSNRAGYGLVSSEFAPRDSGHALWMFYGLNSVAGHRASLMFGYEAFGVSVCPTLGYRELWGDWPKSTQWEDNTISHNTVIVNKERQSVTRVGKPLLFAQLPGLGGLSVEDPGLYPGTTNVFRRTIAHIQTDGNNSYAVDIFHVKGGNDHLISYHALPGPVQTTGLNLSQQDSGSYAGPEVPYGTSMKGPGMGYSWLKDVERDTDPSTYFTLDVQGTPPFPHLEESDNIHVRYHSFTKYTDIALADGVPPGAAPPTLRYLLGHRVTQNDATEELTSTFVSLIEPYRNHPTIQSATRLPVEPGPDGLEPVALRIELNNGAVDYVLAGPDDETTWRTRDGIEFRGRLLAVRTRNGVAEQAWMLRASRLKLADLDIQHPDTGYRGTVAEMNKDVKGPATLWVETPLPVDGSLNGAQLLIENDGETNACYTIHAIEKDGNRYRIHCGDISFVRRFKDNADYAQGHVLNFEVGASWVIPNRIHLVQRSK
ncbi:MAG: heparinase [bacterium]|nr:heparinase [bacterium]